MKLLIGENIKRLRDALQKYPERADETERFLSYYIPAAVQVVSSYQGYENTGLDDTELKKLHDKVLDAENALNEALQKKITEMFRTATMGTIAQAEALQSIIGQDGLRTSEIKLNH